MQTTLQGLFCAASVPFAFPKDSRVRQRAHVLQGESPEVCPVVKDVANVHREVESD